MAGTNTEAAVKPKQLMPHGVWNIEDGGHFVRLLMPTDKGRKCAPCKKETNLCCGGKSSVHIRATDTLALPALQWLRVRISSEEWTDFVAALDTANLEGTVAFAPCEVFPCSFPLLPCQCLLCCVPMQYLAGKALATENALNLAVEKYNKYLFMPRGIVARRQRQCHRPDGREFKFLRIDLAPMPGGPVVHSMLPYGLQPGTMLTDMPMQTLSQWLQGPDAYPCSHLALLPGVGRLFALPRLIPEPRTFYRGDEPELNDATLAEKYGMRNAEFAGNGIRTNTMLRA